VKERVGVDKAQDRVREGGKRGREEEVFWVGKGGCVGYPNAIESEQGGHSSDFAEEKRHILQMSRLQTLLLTAAPQLLDLFPPSCHLTALPPPTPPPPLPGLVQRGTREHQLLAATRRGAKAHAHLEFFP